MPKELNKVRLNNKRTAIFLFATIYQQFVWGFRPIAALLTALLKGKPKTRKERNFFLRAVANWLGHNSSSRRLIREREQNVLS